MSKGGYIYMDIYCLLLGGGGYILAGGGWWHSLNRK